MNANVDASFGFSEQRKLQGYRHSWDKRAESARGLGENINFATLFLALLCFAPHCRSSPLWMVPGGSLFP